MFRTIFSATVVLLCTTTVVLVQEVSGDDIAVEALSEEALAWDAIKQSNSSVDVFAFIQQFPNGEFTADAQALMIDLLWAEMADPAPETETAETQTAEPTGQELLSVTFSAPLAEGDPGVVGRSIEELIDGSPLFPPVEGLPASYWEAQECSNCHQWDRTNLCVQANSYVSDVGAESLTKPHPYGGTFKENLLLWANGGCE